MKKIVSLILGSIAALVLSASVAFSAANEVRVAFFLEWATPNQEAKVKKVFDDALGVPVKWTNFATGGEMTEAMLSGDIDISYSQGLTPFVNAVNAKAPIKLVDIAVTYGMGNTTCIVSNASGITKANAAQLEGKKVAVPVGTMADYVFKETMKVIGADAGKVSVVDMNPEDGSAALQNGDVAMACLFGGKSIENALKAKGQGQRFRFVGRERAYHGMNIGATSVGGMINNVKTFASVLMPGVVHMRHTHLPEHKFVKGQPKTGVEMAEDLERICMNFGAENIAACIVEPVAGSTGTLVPPKGYLNRLREICDKHGIILIFDEVITGWGRMGSAFASQEFGVTPDVMTMAKATTNGVVPMGVVAVKEEIYDTVMDASPKGAVELFHGYTYSGIPIAVAAALAVQDIFEKEDIFKRSKELSPYFLDGLFSLKDLDAVENIRGYGMMGGIDMKIKEKPGRAGYECFKACYEAGINFKATGDCLIIAPQFICEKKHIDEIIEKLRTGISNYTKK